jgi:hypothetical protein
MTTQQSMRHKVGLCMSMDWGHSQLSCPVLACWKDSQSSSKSLSIVGSLVSLGVLRGGGGE